MIHQFSSCCFLPVKRFGDNKMSITTRCSGCGLLCEVTLHDDTPDWMKEQSEEAIEKIVCSPFIESKIERVDFNRQKEYYLEDVKMPDTIGREI